RGELPTTADLRLVEDHLTVGRVRGRIVERAVGEREHLAGGELEGCDVVAAAVALHEREVLAVRAEARSDVVVAVEREALRRPTGGRHAVELRRAAPVRGERDPLAVGREGRLRVDVARVGEPLRGAAGCR